MTTWTSFQRVSLHNVSFLNRFWQGYHCRKKFMPRFSLSRKEHVSEDKNNATSSGDELQRPLGKMWRCLLLMCR